jgi:pyroglutamyl-peptidase
MSTSPRSITVLLTGFGPFPGVPVNATALLVPRIARALRLRRPDIAVKTAVLPTEWGRGRADARAAVIASRAQIVLHFGVSAQATGFVIERQGASACRMVPDAAGVLPPVTAPAVWAANPTTAPAPVADLVGDGPTVPARVPVARIVDGLARLGLPVAVSDDAGGYLCNAVLYQSLTLPTAVRPPVVGFVHVPARLAGHGLTRRAADPACPISQADTVRGAVEIVRVCLEER